MSDAFDNVTYPVSPEQAASAVAQRDDRPMAELRTLVHGLVASHIDGKPGYFALGGLEHLKEKDAKAFALTVSELVGRLLPQDTAGTILRQVTDRGVQLGEGKTGRYSDSRQGGNLHTDAPHSPPPIPDCFALYCVHQAAVGGALCLVHIDDVIDRLPGWAVAELRKDVHFDRRAEDVDDPTVVRPILSGTGEPARVCYLREYIEIGHRLNHVPALSQQQIAAMDALDALLDDPALQAQGKLEPGQMAFINNRILLHGRTEFEDSPSDQRRLMLRTWIQRDPAT